MTAGLMHLSLAFGAVAVLAVLAGIVVKGLLDASRRAQAAGDDVMARAAHGTQLR